MKIWSVLGILIVFAMVSCFCEKIQPKLNVSMYYGTHCEFSKFFIKRQLLPVYSKMSKYINLDLIPYGNTQTTFENNTEKFVCQHGEPECYGNKLHGCAIKKWDPEVSTSFIFCTLKRKKPHTAGPGCVKKLGSQKINYKIIEKCAKSTEGTLLLKENGIRTKALSPKMSGVPWITINNKWSPDIDALMFKHLLKLVCIHLKGSHQPVECNKFYPLQTS